MQELVTILASAIGNANTITEEEEEGEGASSVKQSYRLDFQLDGKCSYSLYGVKVKSW